MSKSQILLNNYNADEALRVGDFALLPINPKPPIITSHPHRNLVQSTYGTFLTAGVDQQALGTPSLAPAPLVSVFNRFFIRKGTALSWTMFVLDPSNINNPADTSNITYTWKRDGIPIYMFNRLNNGKGTPSVDFKESDVTEELSGEYTCEVSNEYGIATTVPFILDIIDLDNHKSFFTNLVNNGDGDGGLDGWIDLDNAFRTQVVNKTSLAFADSTIGDFRVSTGSSDISPYPFTFNAPTQQALFYPTYFKLLKANPNLRDLTTPVSTNGIGTPNGLQDWEWWLQTAAIPTIIANEDFNNYNSVQGFFPGPAWIDRYNNNNQAKQSGGYQTLLDELRSDAPNSSYFTRNKIKFEDDEDVTLQQSVNITEASPFIDNQVAGVDFVTGQFFAYVGLAISKYTITYTEGGTKKIINWLVKDIITYRRHLEGIFGAVNKITPDFGTPIEITPVADDTIKVNLEFLDGVGNTIGRPIEVETPTIMDLWAAKEKVYFPLTLYPIFAFFNPASNPITVFDTTYTHTDALLPLMENAVNDVSMDSQVADLTTQIQTKAAGIDSYTTFLNAVDGWRNIVKSFKDLKAAADADANSGITQDELKDAEDAAKVAQGNLDAIIETLGISNDAAYSPRVQTREILRRQKASLEAQRDFIQSDIGKQIYAGTSGMDPSVISTETPLKNNLDRNAAFLLRRYGEGYIRQSRIIPSAIWEPITNENGDTWYMDLIKVPGVRYRGLWDPGASAFFAIQNQTVIPRGTRLVRINVIAQHKSKALKDTTPIINSWESAEIYNAIYNIDQNDPATGQTAPTSFPLYEYGNPRCGITKVKYQLIPNSETRSNKHVTYQLPPRENTVIGLATDLMYTDAVNTSQPGNFEYNLILPQYPAEQPNNTNDKAKEEEANVEYINVVKGPGVNQPNSKQPKDNLSS
jgi:hypothetical protein